MKNNPKIVNKYDQHTKNKDGSKKYMSLKFSEFKPKEESVSASNTDSVSATGSVDEIPF